MQWGRSLPERGPHRFPRPLPGDDDLVVVSHDNDPRLTLAAYRDGYFPMPVGSAAWGWFSPQQRAIFAGPVHCSRSTRRAGAKLTISVNTAFDEVMARCSRPGEDGFWIDERVRGLYAELHRMGWAHSVEVWLNAELVGGTYGVAIGDLFAAESMFHRIPNASKVAVVALDRLLGPTRLFDVQWLTTHLASLGASEVPRQRYLDEVARRTEPPVPLGWSSGRVPVPFEDLSPGVVPH